MAGISYSDGRGLVLLYNIACDITPIMMKSRIYKFSQAIGPFKNFFNRISAKLILPRIKKIAARGDMTAASLNGLELNNYELCPDGAFSMSIEKAYVTREITNICERLKNSKKLKIGVAPSSVVEKYCSKINISYTALMAEFIQKISSDVKYEVVLFPYSGIQNRKTKKNNDLFITKEIYEKINNIDIFYLDKEHSAEDVNFLITNLDVLVTSRYHAMVISLSNGVIPLIIGWSHKYFETLNQFDVMELCINYSSLDINILETRFTDLIINKDSYKEKIVSRLPKIKEKSFRNFIIIKEMLEN
tara:strand:- start:426 stop:1334 length:909 start_codon:yes stop_codon:yes gene_type:complete